MTAIIRAFPSGLALLAGLLFTSLAGCGSSSEAMAPQLPPPEVTIDQPIKETIQEFYEFTGRAEAVNTIDIRARVSGYLVARDFREGEMAEKDEVLFKIDPRPYQASLDAAKAELSAANAKVAEATARLSRYEKAREKGAIAQDEYDTAVAEKLTAEAAVQAANAKITEAELNLGFTDVIAPITGRMGAANVDVGNLISLQSEEPVDQIGNK